MNARLNSFGALVLTAVAVMGVRSSAAAGESLSYRGAQSATEVEDIGEIAEADAKPPETKYRFNASLRPQYTSNAQLTGNHSSSDFLFFPSLEVGLNRPLGHGFTFDLAARLESGVYARYDDRTFIGYSALATLDWRPKPTLPRIYIGAEPYRYDGSDRGLITEAIGLSVGTDWGFGFNKGNGLAFIGYSFTNYFSDPGIDNRATNRFIIGATEKLASQVYAQIFYQYEFSDFQDADREDSRHVLGLSVTWQLNRHLFSTFSGTFVDNDSTQDHASYQAATASVGLSLQF